ncbi:hypothetical protein CC117_25195 [Parafrankia colletiae]|uniref:Uncharacterized protein n=1 Tax=Parafrankia colletiae TaxID=573497 RepID=A0A1S1QC33_9ACTN|nr:hypothetical protein [Parafrankia colletiae]MCK9902694.1 hypothetical protein [Frankia sp. Cpl3]OHV32368.1 hypothetical protein CC117_25195 [Parafrankia colletiae]
MDTDSGHGTAPDTSGAGRRLDVRVLPNMEMDTWWSRADSPIHPVRHRWQSTVRSCSVTLDGHELSFTVSSYRDEVLAGFDVEETPGRVAVRAWLSSARTEAAPVPAQRGCVGCRGVYWPNV